MTILQNMFTLGSYSGVAITLLAITRFSALLIPHHDNFHVEKFCILDEISEESFIISPHLISPEAITLSLCTMLAGGLLAVAARTFENNLQSNDIRDKENMQNEKNHFFLLSALLFFAVSADLLRHTDLIACMAVGSITAFSGLLSCGLGIAQKMKMR